MDQSINNLIPDNDDASLREQSLGVRVQPDPRLMPALNMALYDTETNQFRGAESFEESLPGNQMSRLFRNPPPELTN
jgi:hypothetical protein